MITALRLSGVHNSSIDVEPIFEIKIADIQAKGQYGDTLRTLDFPKFEFEFGFRHKAMFEEMGFTEGLLNILWPFPRANSSRIREIV